MIFSNPASGSGSNVFSLFFRCRQVYKIFETNVNIENIVVSDVLQKMFYLALDVIPFLVLQ